LRILRKLLIGLVILWGLLALIGRTATPLVTDYRPQIAAFLATQLGVPVSIEGLQARWHGLRPLLELRGLALGDAGESLAVDKVTLDLAIGDLLSRRPLDALRIIVERAQLTLVREPGGQLHLEGFGALIARNSAPESQLALPGRLHLVNTQLIWIDRRYAKPALVIDDINVVAERDDQRLQLRASLRSESGSVELSAQLEGFLATTAWRGTSYLRVNGLDAAELLAHFLPVKYRLHRLQMDLEAWTDWRDATPMQAQGRVALRDLDLQPATSAAARLQIAQAATQFTIDRTPNQVRVGLHKLQLATENQQWPTSNLAFAVTTGENLGQRVDVAADQLQLENLAQWLDPHLPWAKLRESLARLRPAGKLSNLRLFMDRSPTGTDWRVAANFRDLAGTGFDKIPSFDELSGRLVAQPDQLQLELASKDATLTFANLFRQPLVLQTLQGRVDLIRHTDGWQLHSDELQVDSPYLSSRTRLDLRAHTDRPLFIDLQSDFRNLDAGFANRYYPALVMGDKTLRWLDRSIVSGQVAAGSALIQGPLHDFPYEKNRSGIFQVLFDVDDMVLDYAAGWPRLEELSARVKFQGNQLDIEATSGRIQSTQLRHVSAKIASLNPASPIRIKSALQGPLSDPLNVLESEALRARFGRFAATLHGTGKTQLELDFVLPLGRRGKKALDGRLHFDDAHLRLPAWDLRLGNINGRLDFTLDGLSASGIRAQGLGSPLTIDVLTTDEGSTRVSTRGRLSVQNIARQVPRLPLQAAQGAADFVVDVDIPPAGAAKGEPTLLHITSDLVGIGIDLPDPVGKSSDQARPMALRLPFGRQAATGSLDYADRLAARFSKDGKRIDLVLGGKAQSSNQTAPATGTGIHIGGRLEQLDWDAWYAALTQQSPPDSDTPPPLSVDLQIDRLASQALDRGLNLEQLRLVLSHDAGSWQGSVDSTDLTGQFLFSSAPDKSTLQIDLDRLQLRLPTREADAGVSVAPNPNAGPDPIALPELQLEIADLRIDQADLGRLTLAVRRDSSGLRIRQLRLQGGQLALDAEGFWLRRPDGFRSGLQGTASSTGLGDLLVGLGYSRQLEEAAGTLDFNLEWPGHPLQARGITLDGDFALDLGPGRLVELDPGVTRVVGLLNLNALTRRLRLDFSDFYKKGYSFDRVGGSFQFSDAEARTNDLTVSGPSGQIQVRGSADLQQRSLDQQVTVIPQLDATLPIAGALTGGPVAGVAVFVAQKAFAEQVDAINRFEYRISGPWAEPQIEQLGSGGALSKLLQQLSFGTQPGPDVTRPDATPSDPAAAVQATAPQAAQPTTANADPQQPATAAESGAKRPSPLRSLMQLLEKGESHGADIPGGDD